MVVKKRTKKANPKRRSGGRKNPWLIDGNTYYEDDEISKISTAAQAILAASVAPKAPAAPKLSKYSPKDLSIISLVTSSGFKPAMAQGVPASTAGKVLEKLDHDYPLVSGQAKKAIDKTRKLLAEFAVYPKKAKPKAKAKSGISDILAAKAAKQEKDLLKSLTKGLKSRSGASLAKKKTSGPARKISLGQLNRDELLKIALELKKGNPSGERKWQLRRKSLRQRRLQLVRRRQARKLLLVR